MFFAAVILAVSDMKYYVVAQTILVMEMVFSGLVVYVKV